MKNQIYNPFLSLNEYVPDGEPHVFGDRVYLYGSHDAAGSDRFCVQDYTVWSAPVDDLSDWTCHGVTYRKAQDAREKPDFYAPDCVRGNDGRYYLYYVAMGPNVKNFGPMSVAVSDEPAGPFEYLGDIRNPDGTPLLKYLTNDPAVINDNGHIRMYYGWGFGFDFRSKALGWNFRQCGHVYDNLLSAGVKPFVELSFMPSRLAKTRKTGLHYKNYTSPPKDWDEWSSYIKSFIRFLLERYGAAEVESWWFEVWNEPDLTGFFSGTRADYFKLYEVTARAVKSVDEKIRVGGPSTSACKWIDDFLAFCHNHKVPVDFVSTHHYPGDAFGNLITPANYAGIFKTMANAVKTRADLTETLGKMFFSPDKAARVTKDALCKMDDELKAKVGDLPLFMTEWNSMAIFAAPIHDEKYSAAFVMKSVLDLKDDFTGYMFWCLSDLFEEQIQLNKPFVGGFGILTNDNIPKPNFWAFKLLSKLYPERLDVGFRAFGEVEYAAFRKGNSLQIVVVPQSNDPAKNAVHAVEVEIDGAAKSVAAERIDDDHCNPKRLWQELGAPQNLTPKQVEEIKEKSRLRTENAAFEIRDGKTMISCKLYTNDIAMYTIELEE